MPILPSIRPISPLSDAVTAQANDSIVRGDGTTRENNRSVIEAKAAQKIGRQLSVASNGNHYADVHRQEAERALNGNGGLVSPPNGQKEGFFSHLRKRARRLSGRHQLPMSPTSDDVEANAGCVPWSNRSSMIIDSAPMAPSVTQHPKTDFTELDKALENVRYSLEASAQAGQASNTSNHNQLKTSVSGLLKRQHSLPHGQQAKSVDNLSTAAGGSNAVSSRTRRAIQMSTHPVSRYETPDEQDELLDEAIASAHKAAKRLDHVPKQEKANNNAATAHNDPSRPSLQQYTSNVVIPNPYPTPSSSAKRNSVLFGEDDSQPAKPLEISKRRSENVDANPQWPTPPDNDNEWASAAAASIYAAGAAYC